MDLSCLDTSGAKDMMNMFMNCTALERLNLSGFDTSKVTNMDRMFGGCTALQSLDLSTFDTSGLQRIINMFAWDNNLNTIKAGSKLIWKEGQNMPDGEWVSMKTGGKLGWTGIIKTRNGAADTYVRSNISFPQWRFILPSSIASVEEYTFEGIFATSVFIPDGCISIGAGAFANSGMTSIFIPRPLFSSGRMHCQPA